MNEQHIHDALGDISEELLAPVAALRAKKRRSPVRWIALAACLCLLLYLPLAGNGLGMAKSESAVNDGAMEPENGKPNYGYSSQDSMLLDRVQEDESEKALFRAKVLEIHESYILVEPLEDTWERTSSDKIEVSFSQLTELPELAVGDLVEIVYSGTLQECYPARAVGAVKITVVE